MQHDVFLRYILGPNSGYVCVAFIRVKGKEKDFQEQFYKYPEQLGEIVSKFQEMIPTHNVYFCPMVLDKPRRIKPNVAKTPVLWADLDDCDPGLMLVEPSVVVETSPGRYQAYWHIEDTSPVDAESLSMRIAYRHENDGCDTSGYDLTQLMRVPFTYNRKEGYGDPLIKVISTKKVIYRPGDFDQYPPVVKAEAAMFEILEKYNEGLPAVVDHLFYDTPDDWSTALWTLTLNCFEAGMSREEVFLVAREAACNKFKRDGLSETFLWKDVCRAFIKNEENITRIAPEHNPAPKLLTEEERGRIQNRRTFIERYIEWASSLGDAATQYHQAGAFVVLSSLLSGAVRLPTSFGTIKPNLWFMILADTTLTRKSTAMDIAMDLIEDIDESIVLATDGSIEGLMGALGARPGQPSIFLRDEFSGLLESLTKKDHYAGMAEMFTKLYDGRPQKRVLRKETIEVRDPVLLMFCGGIRAKICGLLTDEHISSGFIPRYIFITAESDLSRVKPLGPPTVKNTTGRDDLLETLKLYKETYIHEPTIAIINGKSIMQPGMTYNAYMNQTTWDRYNALEHTMMKEGLKSNAPEIMTPTYDRLCKSTLKAATLIAASRMQIEEDGRIEITMEDLLHAIYYMEYWRDYCNEVVNDVGKTTSEQALDKIAAAIMRKPGVARSTLMQSYHLTARDANNIFQTLEQRGRIIRKHDGRTEKFFPITQQKKKVKV
jgi:predicted transcriptional regulator